MSMLRIYIVSIGAGVVTENPYCVQQSLTFIVLGFEYRPATRSLLLISTSVQGLNSAMIHVKGFGSSLNFTKQLTKLAIGELLASIVKVDVPHKEFQTFICQD